MSLHNSILKNISTLQRLWMCHGFIILILLLKLSTALPFYPASGDWKCNAGRVLANQTLSGGIQAGQFKKAGYVKDITECIRFCCDEEKCDVALFAKKTCYLVSCNNKILCRPVAAQSMDLGPQISYLTHEPLHSKVGHVKALQTFLMKKETPLIDGKERIGFLEHTKDRKIEYEDNLLKVRPSSSDENGQKRRIILDRYPKNSPTKAEMFFQEQGYTANSLKNSAKSLTIETDKCYPATIHSSVSLRYGPDSGDFYDYGEIGDMRQCIDLCCKDKLCDVSFMVGKTCYTVSCYSFEKCQMIPASKKAKLKSQLAYVIKKTDASGKQKLKMSKKHESFLETQEKKTIPEHVENKIDWKFDRDRDGSNKYDEPNVPEGLTKHCKHQKILKNEALVGGQRAGVYTFRGLTPGFAACLSLCCADVFCDVAFLLGKRCYSVQCYKNGECASRPAKSKRLHSTLAFVERSDELDLSEKRTSIPGLLPTDRQYTIWLNITNDEYKDEMVDSESLEFLNFAEKIKGMITEIYGAVQGFKYLEVLALKPKVLRAKINITVDQSTNSKVLLQKMVDILRKGEIKSHDDPVVSRLVVDVRGFKFINGNGDNMICAPEYNFHVHWPLGVYGSFVSVPCPRKANGLTTRQCHGSETSKAQWLTPEFSDCVTDKYEALFREVQLLSSSSLNTPDLTSASIIDRLLQLTTSDTYGSNPPKEFESINNIEEVEAPLPNKKTDGKDGANQQLQLPTAKTASNSFKEELSSDQLKNYLHKMGLSALLGKTNQPDMLSLYKSLSSRNNNIEQLSKPQLVKASSMKYPSHKSETEKLKNLHTHRKHHKPVTKEFDKISDNKQFYNQIKDSLNTHENSPKGTQAETFWTQQRPTGDLGAESPPGQAMIKAPVETTSELVPSSQMGPGSELRTAKDKYDMSSSLEQNRFDNVHSPYSPIRPASISNVDFEPVARSPMIANQHSSNGVQDYIGEFKTNNAVNPYKYLNSPSMNTMQNHQQQGSTLHTFQLNGQQEPGPLSRQNLMNYYSHSLFQPNGIPMYESRRDSTIHPSDNMIHSQYPSQPEALAGASALLNSIRKRRENNERKTTDDVEFDWLFDQIHQRYRRNDETSRPHVVNDQDLTSGITDQNILEFFQPKSITGMNRLYGKAKLTQIPMQPRQTKKKSPKLEDFFKNKKSKIQSVSNQIKRQAKMIPYVKKIEKPVIIDIPTGQIVGDSPVLNVANVSFHRNSIVESEAQYDANTDVQKPPEDKTSSNVKTQNIKVLSEAGVKHKGGKSRGVSKVESGVDVKCTGDETECAKRLSLDVLKSKPAVSNVIEEKQITDPQKTDQAKDKEVGVIPPTISTTTMTTTTMSATTPTVNATTTAIPTTSTTTTSKPSMDSTTSKPKEDTTSDPDYQDIDETEPEGDVQSPQTKENRPEKEEESDKPKPVISITVVNKTEGVSIGSTIETGKKPSKGKKPVKEEKASKEEEASTEKEKKKPSKKPHKVKEEKIKGDKEEKTEKKPTKGKTKDKPKEENDLIFTYDKEEGKSPAPMFGGDIMLTVDISEELAKYAESQTSGPTLIEIEEFLQTASTLLDENNEMEWKHAIRHLQGMSSEADNADTREISEVDALDWRVLHKQKSIEKRDLLMGFVDTVESYGKSVSTLFSRYNSKFQHPIISKNIIMQVRAIVVEELLEHKDGELTFPEYGKDSRLTKWNSGVEKISIPGSLITEKFDATKTIHVTYFRFKNIAEIQQPIQIDGESETQDIVDDSPLVVGSQLLSISVDPPLGEKLKQPVSIMFANNDLSQDKFPHMCAYWNNTKNSFDRNGCELVHHNSSVTTCECYHLTTFAVLVDTAKEGVSPPKKPTDEPTKEENIKNENDKTNEIDAEGGKSDTKEKETEQKPDEPTPPEVSEPVITRPPDEVESPVEEEPKTNNEKPPETTEPPTTTNAPESTAQKGGSRFSQVTKSKWFWILLLALLLLLLLLLLLCCCCCCYRRRKKKKAEEAITEQKDLGSESSGPETIPPSDHLIDKSKEKEEPKKGVVTPGSTGSSRTTSPEPGQSPGWRKLMSHAHHPKQILLKEKALLFKDYVQPYHFLSEKEPPNTSVESIYGSTVTSYPQTANSEVSSAGRNLSPKRKRSYEPKNRRDRTSPVLKDRLVSKARPDVTKQTDSSDTSPDVVRKDITPKLKNKPVGLAKPVDEKVKGNEVIASQMTEATSMEWDPYLENKNKMNKKGGGKPGAGGSPPRRKRNISPISEEDEGNLTAKLSTENLADKSDNPDSPLDSETSYMDSVSGSTRTESETSSPPTRRNTAARLNDSESSESRSTILPGERRRRFNTPSESSENDSPILRRAPRPSDKIHTDTSTSPLVVKRLDKVTSTSDISSPRTSDREKTPPTRSRERPSRDKTSRDKPSRDDRHDNR